LLVAVVEVLAELAQLLVVNMVVVVVVVVMLSGLFLYQHLLATQLLLALVVQVQHL
jgi:hypothetical protein